MNKFIVYKVTFPNQKVYIGISTKDLENRKKRHYSMRNTRKYKFYNALNKYLGQEIWETIDYTSNWDKLCQLEQFYINKFDSCKNGYNSTSGGEGNYNPCDEIRIKMSISQIGRKFTLEHRKKLSLAKLGKKYQPRKKGSGDNIAKSLGMKPFKLFKNGEFIREFSSASSCARFLNTYSACISRCLKYPEKFKSYKQYTFKFS